ncbi:MAG: hypothetical protein Q8R18_06075, partial [bacterium]|nr:hypothetical protein [bacterium]
SLEYTLKLGEYIYTNTDECLAFAGILEMAGIRVSAYNPKENPLEVSVRATYDIPKIKKEVQKAKAASPGIDHYVSIEETSDI